jgi:hypothetical protein
MNDDGRRASWKLYVERAVADYSSQRSSGDFYDEDVLNIISDAHLDQGVHLHHPPTPPTAPAYTTPGPPQQIQLLCTF